MKISQYFCQIRWWLSAALLFVTASAALLFITAPGRPQMDPNWTHEVTAEHEAAVARALESATSRIQELSTESPAAFTGILRQAFGSRLSAEAERDLLEQATRGELPLPSRILVVPDALLPSDAAYAHEEGGTIFLNAVHDTNDEAFSALILHEWSHHLDATLGAGDSDRDEGALFLAGIRNGGPISAPSLPLLMAGLDDHASIAFEGSALSVECGFFGDVFKVFAAPFDWAAQAAADLAKAALNAAKAAAEAAAEVARKAAEAVAAAAMATLDAAASAAKVVAAGGAALVGESELAGALLHSAGDSISDAGNGLKKAGGTALSAAAVGGELYNVISAELDKVVPGLGTVAQVAIGFSPAGPYFAAAESYTAVYNAVSTGKGIEEALAFAALDVGLSGVSRLKVATKALPSVANAGKAPGFFARNIAKVKKFTKLDKLEKLKDAKQASWKWSKATAGELVMASKLGLSHPKSIKRLMDVHTAYSAGKLVYKAGDAGYSAGKAAVDHLTSWANRETEFAEEVDKRVVRDLAKNTRAQKTERDKFRAIQQGLAAAAADYPQQLRQIMSDVGINWDASAAKVNEVSVDPVGVGLVAGTFIFESSDDYRFAVGRRGVEMKELIDQDMETERAAAKAEIKNAVEKRREEILDKVDGVLAANAEEEQILGTIDTNFRKEKSDIGVMWDALDVTRVADIETYEKERQSLLRAIDPRTRTLPPELEQLLVEMPQLEAQAKQLAREVIKVKRQKVQDDITELKNLNQEFTSYSTQVENTAKNHNAKLKQYEAQAKRLAQELIQAEKDEVQGQIAKVEKLNQKFTNYVTEMENAAQKNDVQMQRYQAEGKRLAREQVSSQQRALKADIAKHQSVVRGFESYQAQATRKMDGYGTQLQQYVDEGKRLAQAQMLARQREIEADAAKYDTLVQSMNELYAVVCDQCEAIFVGNEDYCDMPQHAQYTREASAREQQLNALGSLESMQEEFGQLTQSLNYIANAEGAAFIQELRNDGSREFSRVVQNYASTEGRIAQLEQEYAQKEYAANQELDQLGDIAPLQEESNQLTQYMNDIANAQGWAFIQELANAGWGTKFNQLAGNCAALEQQNANLDADYSNQEAAYHQELNELASLQSLQEEDGQLTQSMNDIANARGGAFIQELAEADWDSRFNQLAQDYASIEEDIADLEADYSKQEVRYNQELNQLSDIATMQEEDRELTKNLTQIADAQGGAFIRDLAVTGWDPRFNQLAQNYASKEARIDSLNYQVKQDEAALVIQLEQLDQRAEQVKSDINDQKDKWRQQEEEIDRKLMANLASLNEVKSRGTGEQFALESQELEDNDEMLFHLDRDIASFPLGASVSSDLSGMGRVYRKLSARIAEFHIQYKKVDAPIVVLHDKYAAALKEHLAEMKAFNFNEAMLTRERKELQVLLGK